MSEPTVIDPSKVKMTPSEGGLNDTLTILEGPYEGLQFRYDVVWIDPVNGIQFKYSTLNGTLDEPEDFEQAISRLLAEQLSSQLESGNLIMNGGREASPEEMLRFMDENYGVKPEAPTPEIEIPGNPTKNVAQMIMQQPGVFAANQNESAMTFLDRLAAQGMAAMQAVKGKQ